MCMYVSEKYAEGIFVTLPWWIKNVKSRSKVSLFSNEHHFEIWFPKKKTIMFFWSKLSKLHKKDPILHVATTFSLKQGETRTSHGPIPHPLSKLDANIKGPTHLRWYRIMSVTTWTMHSSALYGIILGQWLHEVCVSFAQCLRTQTQSVYTVFGQFNVILDVSLY